MDTLNNKPMTPFSRSEIEEAQALVRAALPATPQYAWPLLSQRLGATAWVKHENHLPVGAFKVRGGLVYVHGLLQREPRCPGLITATRGNHGQSIAFAAARHGLPVAIVVPHGNSVEKNTAMRALGAELIEHGNDFQAAREFAAALAAERGLHMVPSFHRDLVRGVATGWLEFFAAVQPEGVFVPVGQGSGISACIQARRVLGIARDRLRIVGVVSAHATAYLDSFRSGVATPAPVSTVLADGMACRVPDPEPLALMRAEVDDVIAVSDAEVGAAMRALFADTHNVAEGAGAASLAGAMQQRERWRGKTVGLTLCGGNVDSAVFARVLAEAA
jgi:threonine dehydratase